jgi:hypothetical protein
LVKYEDDGGSFRVIPGIVRNVFISLPGDQEKMIYLGLLVLTSFLMIMFLHLKGLGGAIDLGVTLLAADFFWQVLRLKLFQKYQNVKELTVVLLFLVRIISILLLIGLGHSWLAHRYFWVLAAFVLTLPVWTILGAYGLKRERY